MTVDGDLLADSRKGKKTKKDSFFGWTVFLLLLIAVVFICWIGSYFVFQHPENPRAYGILRKLKKIDAPKRFEPTLAPRGRFYSAEQLYRIYGEKTDNELEQINTDLLQAYIGNYSIKEKEVPYIMGHFAVLKAAGLTRSDVFTTGYAVLARSLTEPKLLIEQLYPAAEEDEEDLGKMLQPGVEVKLERTYDLSAVIHVEKMPSGEVQLTIVPLNYDSYGLADGRSVHLVPPSTLNLAGPLPVFSADQVTETEGASASEKKSIAEKTPLIIARSGPTPDQSVMRVARAQPLHGKAPPLPKKGAIPPPEPTPPMIALKALAVSPDAAAPTPTPVAKVLPVTPPIASAEPISTPALSPSPTPRPVIASSAVPAPKVAGRWQTYRPGQMPRGRLISMPDLDGLVKEGGPKSTTYLQGNFVVKATDGNRAILRSNNKFASALGLGSAAAGQSRVIVEYPEGQIAPNAGEQISRGNNRPFQITSVQRTSNGQMNIYVREVTQP